MKRYAFQRFWILQIIENQKSINNKKYDCQFEHFCQIEWLFHQFENVWHFCKQKHTFDSSNSLIKSWRTWEIDHQFANDYL